MAESEKVVDEEVAAMFDLKLKKKKKKKKAVNETSDGTAQVGDAGGGVEGDEQALGSVFGAEKPDYTYNILLNRIVDLLHQNNPELSEKRRFTMKPPQLMRGASHARFTHIFFAGFYLWSFTHMLTVVSFFIYPTFNGLRWPVPLF